MPSRSILIETPVPHPVASFPAAIQTSTQYSLCPYTNTDHHFVSETNGRRGASLNHDVVRHGASVSTGVDKGAID
jgi:hypothetical protein